MVDLAFLAMATTAGLLLAPASNSPAPANFAPPRLMESVQFDPNAFSEIDPSGMIPSDLMALDGKFGANGALRGMMLVSRNAHENGAFYSFSDPLNPSARASLFLREGRLTGVIYSGGDMRTVLTSEDVGLSRVSLEDARLDLPCGTTGHDMPGQPQPLDGGVAGSCDNGSKVDVLVVYTDAAVGQAGSEASLLDSISWAIGDSNAIYTSSSVGLSVRLVGTSRLTGYVQSGDMLVDLNRLSSTSDGIIDGVHALRDSVGADLVAMVRSDGGGACGIAWILPSNSSGQSALGFSVCALGCFSNLSFTHELGHNMGCCHAPGDGGGCTTGGVFSYSLGNRFTGSDGIAYRTVMAYAPGTRIPRFSSPIATWAGVATGIAGTRDNARTINETALAVSNFRCSADGVGSCGSGGGCYSIHAAPGCNDSACCAAVCDFDNYCCLTTWDSVCVSEALELCSNCGELAAGSCFFTHINPSCDNASCCATVCAADPFCCNNQWDNLCANAAVTLCPNCGDAETGSCYIVHDTPFCDNAVCCESVCAADPFCCNTEWDSFCSNAAITNCAGCGNPNALSCYEPHATPYCADAACCNLVCAADPFCCNNQWDFSCSGAAVTNCAGCGNPSSGNCLQVHPTPYCADAACCTQVCDIDPYCCNSQWDSFCVNESNAFCPACPTDFNNDGNTNAADLSILLGGWGGSGADLNGDSFVNAADLAILLSAWGFCP